MNHNPLITFTPMNGTHFTIITPVVQIIAKADPQR